MKAWLCDDSRPVPGLFEAEVPRPQPGVGELLIEVRAVGVTPTELLWYPTTHTKPGGNRRHAIPGHEFSGVIAAAGAGVEAVAGQEVFGMNDWFVDGATAKFCCTLPSMVTPKPPGLTHAEAASIPIGALTAWQGLFDHARLQSGERVLIHGGSGAVGVFAIQLARRCGAHVITTASGRNREFVLDLGAAEFIDYRTARFEDVARRVDVVFDTVGGSTLQRSWGVLGQNGRLVTIAASSEPVEDDRIKQAFFIVAPDQRQLREVSGLVGSGELRLVIDAVAPFSRAGAAYAGDITERQGHGKTVVAVTQ